MTLMNVIIAVVVFSLGALMLANPPCIHWLTDSKYKNKKVSESAMEKLRQVIGILFIVVAVLIILADIFDFA